MTIRVKNFPLTVVGVLAVKGQSSYGQDQDDVVLPPFYTAERKVLGTSQVSATVTSTTGNGSTNPVLNPYAGVPDTATNRDLRVRYIFDRSRSPATRRRSRESSTVSI